MTDIQNAQAEVRAAYLSAAVFHQQANATISCARKKDRAVVVMATASQRAIVEQRIVEAEANLLIELRKGEE